MVDLVVLHVGPIRHIELLVDGESPLISVVADPAGVSLCSHVFTVKGVALTLTVEELLRAHGFRISVGADHTAAETTRLVRHRALTQNLYVVLFACTSVIVIDFTFLVRVCRYAIVGSIGHLASEFNLTGRGTGSLIWRILISQS